MKVYLAGDFPGFLNMDGSRGDPQSYMAHMKRRLFSYWYDHEGNEPSQEVHAAHGKYELDLFLDSGAFTAFTQKAVITPQDYAAYIHNASKYYTTCSSLDAIGDPAESYRLFKELEKLGCKVQPVFHAREDVSWLVKYMDEGYDYIFIGGMVPETTKWLRGWLDHLFEHYLTETDGTARVKLHGFGLTDQQLMFRYPWYSVDSTSWLFTGMFGGCVFMTPLGLRKVVFSMDSPQAKKLNAPHYNNLSAMHQREVDSWLEEYGVTAEECAATYSYRHIVNAQTFTRMESLGTTTFHADYEGLFGS